MTIRLLRQIDIDKNKACEAIKLGVKFCEYISEHMDPVLHFGFFDAKHTLDRVDEIIGLIILKSKMASKEKCAKNNDVDRIIEILEKCKSPHALLSWCVADPGSKNRYERIMTSVLQVDNAYTQNANQAIYYLIDYGVEIDDKIVTIMTDSVVTTYAYNVNTYAIGLEYLIRKGFLNEDRISLVADALPKLDAITQIHISDDDEDVMQKLGMRKVTSILARTIYKRYEANGKQIPTGVAHWKKISEDPEEFAEVRLIWDRDLIVT